MHIKAEERAAAGLGLRAGIFCAQENRDYSREFRNLTPEQLQFFENLAAAGTAERDRNVAPRWRAVTRKRKRENAVGHFCRQGNIIGKIARLQRDLKAEGSARAALAREQRAELLLAREAAGRELSAVEVGPPHFNWNPGPLGRLDWLPPVADLAKVWIRRFSMWPIGP